ncbi:unnamed protein product, partial [Gulo gulo]
VSRLRRRPPGRAAPAPGPSVARCWLLLLYPAVRLERETGLEEKGPRREAHRHSALRPGCSSNAPRQDTLSLPTGHPAIQFSQGRLTFSTIRCISSCRGVRRLR